MSDSPSPFDSGKRAHTSDDESYPTDGQAASTSSKAASSLGSKAAKPLNRTSRACNACRRQKMRCLEAETGCCTRCRKAGLPCTFEKPLREAQVGEERIKSLESTVFSIQSTLQDLVAALKNPAPPGQAPQPPAPPPPIASSSQYQQQQPQQQQQQQHHSSNPSSLAFPYAQSPFFPPASAFAFPTSAYTPPGGYSHHAGSTPGSSNGFSSTVGMGGMMTTAEVLQHHPGRAGSISSAPSATGDPVSSRPAQPGRSLSSSSSVASSSAPTAHYSIPSGLPPASTAAYHNNSPFLPHNHAAHARALAHPHQNAHHPSSLVSASASSALPGPSPAAYAQPHHHPTSSARNSPVNSPSHSPSSSARPLLPRPHFHPQADSRRSSATSSSSLRSHDDETELEIPRPSALAAPFTVISDLADRETSSSLLLLSNAANASTSSSDLASAANVASSTTAGGRVAKRARFEEQQSNGQGEGATAAAARNGAMSDTARLEGANLNGKGKGRAADDGEGEEGGQLSEHEAGRGFSSRLPPLDPITAGLLTVASARTLFDIYWRGAHKFLAVYDHHTDTFDSLRARSPFSIAAMAFVGCRVRDGGGPKSELQIKLWEHIRRISQETLFTPTTDVETVQATILAAGWNDSGWLLGGHAVRLAFELGCHSAFLKLARSGMGASSSPPSAAALSEDEDRRLVVLARVWFCLYIIEHQMSYGCGRPPIVREDETILRCREFLSHPLAIETDWRLISTVELMALRSPLHSEFSDLPEDAPVNHENLVRLQRANVRFARWYEEWDLIFAAKFGMETRNFYRESLQIQKEYAELFHNCTALRGVRDASDVRKMDPAQRDLAIRALRNAQACLETCLRGVNYREALKYAVHYTHICAAFAASLLIRLARIFPTELNLRQTARDVEELAKVLASVPAGRYARSLRLTLRSARRRKVMPPPSMPGSPTSRADPSTPRGLPPMLNQLSAPSPAPAPAFHLPHHAPPVDLAAATAALDEESPGSFSMEFDWGYTTELADKVGLDLQGGTPIWLHGSDIGSSQLPSAGMENFFLPSDLDHKLASLGDSLGGLAASLGFGGPDDPPIW